MIATKTKFTILQITFLTAAWVGSVNCSFAQHSPGNSSGSLPRAIPPNQTPDDSDTTNDPFQTKSPAAGSDHVPYETHTHCGRKSKMRWALDLIDKGDRMMKNANADSLEYKKGKILKQVGERNLAELKASSQSFDQPLKFEKAKNN